jgi:general secretion pathway protein G
MIELIFVLIVLGILATIAIPKLAAVRDDAEMSRMAKDIMTGSFEIASYVVAKGYVDPKMSNMSNAIRGLVIGNRAVERPREVDFAFGTTSDCVMLDINNSTNGDQVFEILDISFADASADGMCKGLQDIIDEGEFPIPLKGKYVVR